MPGQTPIHDFPYPELTDKVGGIDQPGHIKSLAEKVEDVLTATYLTQGDAAATYASQVALSDEASVRENADEGLGAQIAALTQLAGAEGDLLAWAELEAWRPVGTITRDSYGIVSTCDVVWPDGSAGTLTVTKANLTWLTVDAYEVTHDDSGDTAVQEEVTRDANGAVVARPAITITEDES